MTGAGHRTSGVICAASAFGMALQWQAMSFPIKIAFAVALYAGATAPDWLERPLGHIRLVPHRTLTHWWLLWVAACGAAFFYLELSLAVLIFAFSGGALVHISGDAITPMGVPWFNPMRQHKLGFASSSRFQELAWLAGIGLLAGMPWLWFNNMSGLS